jgi:hypothetical protein
MMKRIFETTLAAAIGTMRALLVLALCSPPILASQNPLFSPTTGAVSGLSLTQNFNSAIDSVNTCNSGTSAPSNQLSGSPSAGNCWYNTSTGVVSFYDGANWLAVGTIDATNHVWTPVIGGGQSTSVTSATTTNLCGSSGGSPTQSALTISGTTTITGFGSNCAPGQIKILTFSGILTLTYNASSMLMPTNASITTAAGDVAVAISLGSGNWQIALYQRGTGAVLSSVGLNVGSGALASSALPSYSQPINLQLNASASGNQLTVALKTQAGADPTSTTPILIGFRDQTLTNGTDIVGAITAAANFTLGSSSSMGCTTAVLCRLWITAICVTESAGSCTSILVGLSAQANATACYPLMENILQSTGSGTAGGTTLGTIYTSTASLTGKAIRILGFVEAIYTSGTGWATTPAQVQLFSPGMKKPCDVVQELYTTSTTQTTNTTSSAAALGPTLAITPTSAANLIEIETAGSGNNGSRGTVTMYIVDGSTRVGIIYEPYETATAGTTLFPLSMLALYAPNSTSAQTFGTYGATSTGTLYYPYTGDNAGVGATIRLREIMS